MNKNKETILTPNEVAVILIGIVFGINVSTLPNNLVRVSEQDAWISAAIGALYPLYIILIAIYISRKFPKKNIFVISNEYLGKTLGTALNILFTISILTYLPASLSNLVIVVQNYASTFVKSIKIYIAVLSVAAYCACKGLKSIRRICSINFYILISIIIISLSIVNRGSFLNVKPILATNMKNLITASIYSIYDYSCIEIIFLIYPFINDSSKVKSAGLKAVGFICFAYTYIVFISIYHLGIDVIPKTYWAFFSVAEDIKFMNIANFRYLFIFFLIFIAIKSISIFYYFFILSIDNIKKVNSKKTTSLIISIFLIYICNKYYSNTINRNVTLQYTVPISVIYNLFYITLIACLILIKKDD